NHDSVPTPRFETVFGKNADKKLNSNDSHHKSDDISHKKHQHIIALHQHFIAFLFHSFMIPVFQKNRIYSHRKHGRYRKEKRKFRSRFSGKLLLHSSNDGSRTSAGSRHHGKTLPKSDDDGTFIGNIFFVVNNMDFKKFVNKKQDYST